MKEIRNNPAQSIAVTADFVPAAISFIHPVYTPICPTKPQVPIPDDTAVPFICSLNRQVASGPVIAEVTIGAIQILGNAMHIAQFAGQEGFGFQGITVALIASSNPIGCIFAGLFYGAMKYGGSKLNLVGAPKEVLDIIMGAIVLVIAISHVFKTFAQKKMQKGGK